MRLTVCAFLLTFVCASSGHAATIFTSDGSVAGEILEETKNFVTIRNKTGIKEKIARDKILTIYDDEEKLVWSHPTIAKSDSTPDQSPQKIELSTMQARGKFRGVHLGATGALGYGYGNATFSSYPLSTGPDYRHLFEVGGNVAWYLTEMMALTGGVGYGQRLMPVKGLTVANVGAGNGYWAMQFIDVRAAYRIQADFLFFDAGILTAIKLADAPLILETASATISQSIGGVTQQSFAAISLALGVNFALSQNLFLTSLVRVDHGISRAISYNVASATDTAGNVISTAPLSLVPLAASLQLGAAWRL